MRKLKFRFPEAKKNGKNSRKKYANPVFPEWSSRVAGDLSKNFVRKIVLRYSVFLFILCFSVCSISIVGGIYSNSLKNRADAVVAKSNSILNEYGNVLSDIKVYEEYAFERMSPPIYLQYSAIGTVVSKMGFFIDRISFEQTKDVGALKESFAVETGKSPDAVEIIGIWSLTGSLLENADNQWVLSLRETLDGVFSLYGVRAYTSASVQEKKVNATVVVWNE